MARRHRDYPAAVGPASPGDGHQGPAWSPRGRAAGGGRRDPRRGRCRGGRPRRWWHVRQCRPVRGHSARSRPAPFVRRPGAAALGASAATRRETATWIAGQVAASAIVACDPAMCTALEADGLPATRLVVLGTAAPDPLGSDIVVATLAVRNQFGTRLQSVYAPVVIASFGAGAGRIDVRTIAPDGAAANLAALAADRSSRVSAGSQLLRNPRIIVAAGPERRSVQATSILGSL